MRLIGLAVVLPVNLLARSVPNAQQAGKAWWIGSPGALTPDAPRYRPFHEGLSRLGYGEGQNVAFVWRSSGGKAERFAESAAELARLKVDVIVGGDNPAIAAAQKATKRIRRQLRATRGPGNITGCLPRHPELVRKQSEMLKAVSGSRPAGADSGYLFMTMTFWGHRFRSSM